MNQNELYFENETRKHQQQVAKNLMAIAMMLMERALTHDRSKMESPEREGFVKATPKLKDVEYGAKEYRDNLDEIQDAVQHHYAVNPHHPEYFDINGFTAPFGDDSIRAMHLVDVIEMLCDWVAAIGRQPNGSVKKSIEVNTERFNLDPQLRQLFANTMSMLENIGEPPDPGKTVWSKVS